MTLAILSPPTMLPALGRQLTMLSLFQNYSDSKVSLTGFLTFSTRHVVSCQSLIFPDAVYPKANRLELPAQLPPMPKPVQR